VKEEKFAEIKAWIEKNFYKGSKMELAGQHIDDFEVIRSFVQSDELKAKGIKQKKKKKEKKASEDKMDEMDEEHTEEIEAPNPNPNPNPDPNPDPDPDPDPDPHWRRSLKRRRVVIGAFR